MQSYFSVSVACGKEMRVAVIYLFRVTIELQDTSRQNLDIESLK